MDFRERSEERSGRRLRVLVIDDDESARNTVSRFATRQGTTVVGASTGLQGIAKAQSERPDVILLDMMMPGVGGHEVLARLRADESTAKIPVIVVTSHFINDDERRQILSRASAVIYRQDLSQEAVTTAIDSALRP
ncbi:MAG TPA: response regulator [Thermoanaerobaculia bacterium]|nr:response regulator [Thermoanaerobaculia bacterium]